MIVKRTNAFKRDYKKLHPDIQTQTDAKLRFLAKDITYPSLRVKSVQRYKGVFEASISKGYRVLFKIVTGRYVLLRVGKHDILEKK